ncbi:MAG: HD domain-containing protein [Clostridia bacterium]|nr:HD domain-containing protein [Clostridia bacterium]
MNILMPSGAETIINRLYEYGYEAYAVGGCVRDALMGKAPDDWDITTNAEPQQVKDIFTDAKVIETGIAHGTVTVILNSEHYEVTTFRCDGKYSDHRHPDKVEFAKNLKEDLARRDFTINAMAYNHKVGIIDLHGGFTDLKHKIIRAVGVAEKRFEEDGLRILRGLRFASCLGFEIDDNTALAMKKCKSYLCYVAGERKYVELCKLLSGQNVLSVLLEYAYIIAEAVPEINSCIGFDQKNEHHIYDVWEHTVRAVAVAPKDKITRLALLLHDSGKPSCFSIDDNGVGHFYGHTKYSIEICNSFFSKSGEANEVRQRVKRLIEYHDSVISSDARSIKRWLGRLGEEDIFRLIDIKKADCLAQAPKHHDRVDKLEELRATIKEVLEEKPCFTRAKLAVNGRDIMDLGVNGHMVGKVLDYLLDSVIEEKCVNTRDELLKRAEYFIDME